MYRLGNSTITAVPFGVLQLFTPRVSQHYMMYGNVCITCASHFNVQCFSAILQFRKFKLLALHLCRFTSETPHAEAGSKQNRLCSDPQGHVNRSHLPLPHSEKLDVLSTASCSDILDGKAVLSRVLKHGSHGQVSTATPQTSHKTTSHMPCAVSKSL